MIGNGAAIGTATLVLLVEQRIAAHGIARCVVKLMHKALHRLSMMMCSNADLTGTPETKEKK